jgi:hypothetical protein
VSSGAETIYFPKKDIVQATIKMNHGDQLGISAFFRWRYWGFLKNLWKQIWQTVSVVLTNLQHDDRVSVEFVAFFENGWVVS